MLFLAMPGVIDHAGVLKCIHMVAVDAENEGNPYICFVADYFHSMAWYLNCLHSDLDILEGLFWYFNHAASFSTPEIADNRPDLLMVIWEGLEAGKWAEFLGQHHYEREYPLTFL